MSQGLSYCTHLPATKHKHNSVCSGNLMGYSTHPHGWELCLCRLPCRKSCFWLSAIMQAGWVVYLRSWVKWEGGTQRIWWGQGWEHKWGCIGWTALTGWMDVKSWDRLDWVGLQGSTGRGSDSAVQRMVERCGRESGKITLRRFKCTWKQLFLQSLTNHWNSTSLLWVVVQVHRYR